MGGFDALLTPGRIGTLELRNRILMAPMGDSLANPDGTVSDAQLGYFEARARGGAALLLIGSVAVAYPDGCMEERQVAASRDSDLEGLRALADRVHEHGAALGAQLVYNGALARLDIARAHPMLVPAVPRRPNPDRLTMMLTEAELAGFMAPYAVPGAKVEYQVATDEDLAGVVGAFATATRRCRDAGLDAVEIHAGHGYLIDEFLSPASNPRTDAWGGDVAGRARLLLEVVRATRAEVGPDFPVWIRINAREYHKPDGEQFDEQLDVIRLAVAEGIDAVHLTAYSSMDVATGPTDSYAPHRVGGLASDAARVRAAVTVPVITFGRFEPDEAEQVLATGQADFIAMGRKLLADPDLPNKLATGDVARVRPCLYQYRCIGNIFVNESLACVANPATGREHEAVLAPPASPQRVVVIGGGAAGLEVTRVLAGHGHSVTLLEQTSTFGGVLTAIAGIDPVLDRMTEWLRAEVGRTGARLRVGATVTKDHPALQEADLVVVATGPRWTRPDLPGAERVITPAELPAIDALPSGPVVLLGGGKPALTLALAVRATGREVAIVESGNVFGGELGLPGRWRLVADAEAAGIEFFGESTVAGIGPDTITIADRTGIREHAAITLITATREAGDPALAGEIASAGHAVRVVGDAMAARGFEGLTRDAEDVARALAATTR